MVDDVDDVEDVEGGGGTRWVRMVPAKENKRQGWRKVGEGEGMAGGK